MRTMTTRHEYRLCLDECAEYCIAQDFQDIYNCYLSSLKGHHVVVVVSSSTGKSSGLALDHLSGTDGK